MEFCNYLEKLFGTRNWVVAHQLTPRLKDKGYELAISQKKFAAIRQAFEDRVKSPAYAYREPS